MNKKRQEELKEIIYQLAEKGVESLALNGNIARPWPALRLSIIHDTLLEVSLQIQQSSEPENTVTSNFKYSGWTME